MKILETIWKSKVTTVLLIFSLATVILFSSLSLDERSHFFPANLTNSESHLGAVIAITVFVLLTGDILLDLVMVSYLLQSDIKTADLFVYERLSLAISFALPSFGYIICPTAKAAAYFIRFEMILTLCIIAAILIQLKSDLINTNAVCWFCLFSCFSWSVDVYCLLTIAVGVLSVILILGTFVTLFYVIAPYYKLYTHNYQGLMGFGFTDSLAVFFIGHMSVIAVVSLVLKALTILSFRSIPLDITPTKFLAGQIVNVIFNFSLILILGRISRYFVENARMEQQIKTSLVRSIGHEMKFPMNSASLGVFVLKDKVLKLDLPSADKDEISDVFCRVTESLNDSIKTISVVSAMQNLKANVVAIDKRPTNLPKLVKSALKVFSINAKIKQITIDTSGCDSKEFYVTVDVPKIVQVVQNFVSNSLKFTPIGGKIWVSLRLIAEEFREENITERIRNVFNPRISDISSNILKFVRIEVRDSGIGISPELMNSLFADRVDGNTGEFGLQIAKQYVRLHNGRIGGYSPGNNEGSIFYFDLLLDAIPSDLSSNISNDYVSNTGDDNFNENREDAKSNLLIDRGRSTGANTFLDLIVSPDVQSQLEHDRAQELRAFSSLHRSSNRSHHASSSVHVIGFDHGCPPMTFDSTSFVNFTDAINT